MAGNEFAWWQGGKEAEPPLAKRARLADQQGAGEEGSETSNGPIKGYGKGRKDVVVPSKAEWVGSAPHTGRTGLDWSRLLTDQECYKGVYRATWEQCNLGDAEQQNPCMHLSCPQLTYAHLNLQGLGDVDAQIVALLRIYREEALQLAVSLAAGQLCSVWIYEFAYSHQAVPPLYRYLEAELLGTVPYLPLPDLFQAYIAGYNQYRGEDSLFLGFNRYPGTLILPPGYMNLLTLTPNLTIWQLLINHLAGCKLIQPSERVFQVFHSQNHYSFLLSTPTGSFFYSDGSFFPTREEVLLPNLWFNQVAWPESRTFPYALTLPVVLTLIDKLILQLIGEESDGRIRKYDLQKPQIREKYCHSENCEFLASRLKSLGTAYCPAQPLVPLPPIPYSVDYTLVPTHSVAVRMLYDFIGKGLGYGMDCPLATPLFRFAPVLQNEDSPYIVTVLANAAVIGGSLDQVADALGRDESYFSVKPYAVFLFRWETKVAQASRVSNRDWEALKDTLNLPDSSGKQQLLELYAPSSLTVLIAVLNQASKHAVEAANLLPRRLNRLFSMQTEVLDLWSLEDGGAIMNLFTVGNAVDVAGKYKIGYSVEEGALHLFADFLAGLSSGRIEGSVQTRIEEVVREGVEKQGLEGEDLLLYSERTIGSHYLPSIVQVVARYGRFTPVHTTPRPAFPKELFPVQGKDLATMSDSQLTIWSFIEHLCKHKPSTRKLLICGSAEGNSTGFAYFLAKHFRVYWKVGPCPAARNQQSTIPQSTELVVIDERNLQANDFSWAQASSVPVLILTSQKEEVICKMSSNRVVWGQSEWEVVSLAGKKVRFGEVERVEEMPGELVYGGIQAAKRQL